MQGREREGEKKEGDVLMTCLLYEVIYEFSYMQTTFVTKTAL